MLSTLFLNMKSRQVILILQVGLLEGQLGQALKQQQQGSNNVPGFTIVLAKYKQTINGELRNYESFQKELVFYTR